MKKPIKKLRLSTETVRSLRGAELTFAGAGSGQACDTEGGKSQCPFQGCSGSPDC